MKYPNILILTFLFSGCNKDCNIPGGYVFELQATLTPAKDTFNIGDTINIVSEFEELVYDRTTRKYYNLRDFKFYPYSDIIKIDGSDAVAKFSGAFDLSIDTIYDLTMSKYSDGGDALLGQYNYNNGRYVLKYKMIPKAKGLFLFKLTSLLYPANQSQDFEDRCRKSKNGLDAFVNLNNGSDNNVDFLLNSPDQLWQNYWQKREDHFHKFGGYCFYVK